MKMRPFYILAVFILSIQIATADDFIFSDIESGVIPPPIVIADKASLQTRNAAVTLMDYIEKITGVRPELIEGCPEPFPFRAVWVGYQHALDKLFPKIDFNFRQPEEILIAANTKHLVIVSQFANVRI